MVKVVLITSRMFDEHKNRKRRMFGKQYAKLFIENNEGHIISEDLRRTDDFKRWFALDNSDSVIMKKKQQCCEESVLKKIDDEINAIVNSQMFRDNSFIIKDDYIEFFDDMGKLICNKKKASSSEFHAGLYIVDDSQEAKLYLAEEYPNPKDGDFSLEMQKYLDALLEMVVQQNSDISDLLIISHDRDWNQNSECVISQEKLESYTKMKNLQKLLKKKTKIKVICFQHDVQTSNVYGIIKNKITDQKSAKSLFEELNDFSSTEIQEYFDGNKEIDELNITKILLPPEDDITDFDFLIETKKEI